MSQKIITFFSKHLNLILLGIIFLLALLLRAQPYFKGDFYYSLDQSRDLLLVKEIVTNKDITLIGGRSGIGGIFHGPAWLYMIVPFFMVAGGNPFYTLVPLFLVVNLSLIILAYVLFSKIYDKKTGLIVSFLYAISHALLSTSVSVSNAQMMPVLFVLYLYFITLFLRRKESVLMWIGFIIGFGFHFESAFAIFLIPLTLVACILNKKIPHIKFLLGSAFMFMLGVSNFILFELRHKFLMTQSALKLLKGDMPPMDGYKEFANIGYRTVDRMLGIKNYFVMAISNEHIFFQIILAAVMLLGSYLFVQNRKSMGTLSKEYIFVALIPFLYYIMYIAYPFPLWSHYTMPLIISACFFIGLTLKIILESQFRYAQYIVLGFLIFLSIPSFIRLYQQYIGQDRNRAVSANYRQNLEVGEYIFKNNTEKKLGYFVYDPGFLTYNIDYIMWYLGKKNNVEVVNEKLPNTYLIQYTAPKWNPGARAYWKEHVINTKGTVISSQEFPKEGIRVEKIQPVVDEVAPDPNYFQNLHFR